MNGIVSKAYSVATSHVVCASPLTAKCREAYKNDVPVMNEQWVRVVWEESQKEIVDATDKKYIKYTCSVFHNIQICLSQIPSSMKTGLEKTIKENGNHISISYKLYV